MFVGHADAAVQLHHLAANQLRRLAADRLGQAHGLVDVGAPRVDRLQRRLDDGAHQLQFGEHLRHPVLQRLEGRQRLPELNARLQIIVGRRERLFGKAEHLGGDERGRAVDDRYGQVRATKTDRRSAREGNLRMAASVRHMTRGDRHAFAGGHKIQTVDRRNHESDGDIAFGNEELGAGQHAVLDHGRRRRRIMHRTLVDRERHDRFAGRDPRQPFALRRVVGPHVDRGRRRTGRRQRRSGQIASHLLDHEAKRKVAERRSAMRLGHDDTGPPHLAHFLPRCVVERVPGIAQSAKCGHRRFVICPFARHVAQHRLFVVQHGHRSGPR